MIKQEVLYRTTAVVRLPDVPDALKGQDLKLAQVHHKRVTAAHQIVSWFGKRDDADKTRLMAPVPGDTALQVALSMFKLGRMAQKNHNPLKDGGPNAGRSDWWPLCVVALAHSNALGKVVRVNHHHVSCAMWCVFLMRTRVALVLLMRMARVLRLRRTDPSPFTFVCGTNCSETRRRQCGARRLRLQELPARH